MLARILFLLALLLFPGALRAAGPPAEKAGFASKLTIYLAKGAPDACGPGCDRWIAIEGQIDQDAASRIRRFLAGVKDTQRPIYLHSPGGNVEQSYVIGRLLRGRQGHRAGWPDDRDGVRRRHARGRRVPEDQECDRRGRGRAHHLPCDVQLGLRVTCFSARPRARLPPMPRWRSINSRLILTFRGNPPPEVVAEARRRRIAGADHDRAAYIAAMGISRELDALIRTVKFENLHVLTRPELYRFGIDTRPLAETKWRLEKGARPFVSKLAALKKESDASFRTMEWRLYCENKKRVPLMFASEIDASTTAKKSILMAASADLSKEAGGPPVRLGKYEVWSGAVDPDMVEAVLASHSLQVRETIPEAEGKAAVTSFDIDMSGLTSVWTQLGTSCSSAAAGPAKPWPANAPQPTPWTAIPWKATGSLPNVSAAPSATPAP
ncbi:hypothetical protein ACU4GH_24265 [Bradyrhizobium betae]